MSSEPLTIELGPTQAYVARKLASRWGVPAEEAVMRALGEALLTSDPHVVINRRDLIEAIRALPGVPR
jgi:hypothetical protein